METVDTLVDDRCRNCCSWCAWGQPNFCDAVLAIANHAWGQPGVPEARFSMTGTQKASEMLWETKKNKASLNQCAYTVHFRRVEWRGALVDLTQKREVQQCHDLFCTLLARPSLSGRSLHSFTSKCTLTASLSHCFLSCPRSWRLHAQYACMNAVKATKNTSPRLRFAQLLG